MSMDLYLHLHHLHFIGGHLFNMFNSPLLQFYSPIILMIFNFIPLALTISTSLTITSSSQVSFRVDIARINSRLKLPNSQTAQTTIKLEEFGTQTPNPTPSPSFKSLVLQADGEFIMTMSLGTPPKQLPAIMDTGSDLVWTQCMPCMACYHQATPVFDPNASSSFSPLPCSNSLCASKTKKCSNNLCRYRTLYGDMSFTQGYLATDTFILGDSTHNVSLPNIGFGCGNNNGGSGLDSVAGIIGLGRGPLSLVTQLKVKKFSYCLPVLGENKKGTLSFGSLADHEGCNASNSQGTPILKNPVLPSRYYVSLEGISVDDTLLPIMKSTFVLKKDGTGGMIFDTGTTLTYLVQEAYQVLKQEFVKRTRLPVVFSSYTDLDLCFRTPAGRNASSHSFPKLKFHFKDLVLELPKDNYLTDASSPRMVCLTIMPSNGVSLVGSQLQQNFVILHDLEKHTISFFPSQCAYG